MRTIARFLLLVGLVISVVSQHKVSSRAASGNVTITVESWRYEDLATWKTKIIPAFEATHPTIHVVFAPSPENDYNSALNAKLTGGTAGDVITCRPFDLSLTMYQHGHLADLTNLPGMQNFSKLAKVAWSTDDGTHTFCVPTAAVIHGFIYNATIFQQLGLKPPVTQADFFKVVAAIKKDGRYVPIDIGTNDQWEAATMGWQNIGVTYWKGEQGRLALINGTAKASDPQFVQPFQVMAGWRPYLASGYQAQHYADSQTLFELGKAAIYPAGSWEIAGFNAAIKGKFKLGAFPPPVPKAGDQGYINDHPDTGFGMNAATKHPAETRTFLEWMTTPQFEQLYSNLLPGFFSLASFKVPVTDPLAQQILNWRTTSKSTIRITYQILSRGTPNFDSESYRVSVGVLNGTMTPQEAGNQLQAGLAKWYKPQQHWLKH
jgi:raffinose/stachyose/melibiose transport system substrate-binding protein